MASDFQIQVVHLPSKQIVSWAPGREDERDIIEQVCFRVAKESVGVFRTNKHVVSVVRAALEDTLHSLKAQV